MKLLKWIAPAIVAVAAAVPLAGGNFAVSNGSYHTAGSRPIVVDEPLAPAVVIATKPSLSEILDIILRERPTASDLAKGTVTGEFPKGSDEAHIVSLLSRYTDDRERVNRIASALVKESRRRKIGSSLLVGVMLTENPWLDPRATSFVGARGLMQVMPFHAGKWGCASSDLFDIESNICHGVAVLADNLGRSKTLQQALLGYNGCVRGTNTPDCWRYPAKVYREARKTTAAEDDIKPFSSVAVGRGSRRTGS
jgi:hypothetical protein